MAYEITLIDKYGEDYTASFTSPKDIKEEIDKLDGYLEDVSGTAYSRLLTTIIELQDLLASVQS
jgi:hypothetical protein